MRFKINLQHSQCSLTLILLGQVLHVRKKVPSLKHTCFISYEENDTSESLRFTKKRDN